MACSGSYPLYTICAWKIYVSESLYDLLEIWKTSLRYLPKEPALALLIKIIATRFKRICQDLLDLGTANSSKRNVALGDVVWPKVATPNVTLMPPLLQLRPHQSPNFLPLRRLQIIQRLAAFLSLYLLEAFATLFVYICFLSFRLVDFFDKNGPTPDSYLYTFGLL